MIPVSFYPVNWIGLVGLHNSVKKTMSGEHGRGRDILL